MERDPASPSDDVLADDPRASLRARTQTLLGITAAGWAFYSARSLVTRDFLFSAETGLAGLLTVLVYFAQRRNPRWTRLSAHANSAIAVVFILLTCLLSGQVLSASLAYLVCVPLAMGYLQGVRNASIWAAICAATAVLNDVLMRVMPLRPVYVTNSNDYTIATIVLIVLTVGLVTGSERLHAAHVAALKKREATIESLNRGLSRKNEEAEEARDRAIAASKAKGDFVATLSHEIRTPLNGVLGMAGLLLDDNLPPQQRELVRTIRTSGDALLSLLNDLLDFSKIEAGRMELDKAPFDVRDCVEDAFDLFGVVAANKRLRLACVVPPGTATRLVGDAGRVRQILVNLIGNAVKFTNDGEIVIEVGSKALEDDVIETSIAVRDTGIGIAKNRIAMLFEPFAQVDTSTTNKFGGTGLGLAICRRLAEAMGGRAWAESKLGSGATFHVTLQLPVAEDTQIARGLELAGKRVIVASPHEATRRMILAQITLMGASSAACETAVEVVRELAKEPTFAVIAEQDCLPVGAPVDTVRLLLPWETPPGMGPILRVPVRRAELRRLLADPDGIAAPVNSTPIPRLVGVETSPPSVLVAEDNPVNQRVARLMLERLGCRTDVVGNGREALDALRARSYDLVLMDVRMPEMDGIDATRALRREIAADRQPVVVAMTANVQIEDRQACEEAGMDGFLPKPIRPADLTRVLELPRRRREAARAVPSRRSR